MLRVVLLLFACCAPAAAAVTPQQQKDVFSLRDELLPPLLNIQPVQTIPHNPQHFTQGLCFASDVGKNRVLLESTGVWGSSKLIKYALTPNNRLIQQWANVLPNDVFAEGVATKGDQVLQLTYQNRLAYAHSLKNLDRLSTKIGGTEKAFLSPATTKPYPPQLREGWGATSDGKDFIVSDGTSSLLTLDAETLVQKKRTVVTYYDMNGAKREIDSLNELEYIPTNPPQLLINYYESFCVLRVDLSGKVVGVLKLDKRHYTGSASAIEAMNGIAYHAPSDSLYVTGKGWNQLYRVSLNRANKEPAVQKNGPELISYPRFDMESLCPRVNMGAGDMVSWQAVLARGATEGQAWNVKFGKKDQVKQDATFVPNSPPSLIQHAQNTWSAVPVERASSLPTQHNSIPTPPHLESEEAQAFQGQDESTVELGAAMEGGADIARQLEHLPQFDIDAYVNQELSKYSALKDELMSGDQE